VIPQYLRTAVRAVWSSIYEYRSPARAAGTAFKH